MNQSPATSLMKSAPALLSNKMIYNPSATMADLFGPELEGLLLWNAVQQLYQDQTGPIKKTNRVANRNILAVWFLLFLFVDLL